MDAATRPPVDDGTAIHAHARRAGVLYLLIFLLAPWVYGAGKATALVSGDAAASAANVVRLADAFRGGVVIESAIIGIELTLAALLYVMFRRVGPTLALGAALARGAEAIVQAVNLAVAHVALLLATGRVPTGAANAAPEVLVLTALELHAALVLVWGFCFGLHLAALAALAWRSGVVPRWLAALLGVAAAGYVVESVGGLVWPAATGVLDVAVVVMAVPGELAFVGWLLGIGRRRR